MQRFDKDRLHYTHSYPNSEHGTILTKVVLNGPPRRILSCQHPASTREES